MNKSFQNKAQGSLEYLLIISGAILVATIIVIFLINSSIPRIDEKIDNSKCSPYGNQNYCNIADIEGDGLKDCYW